MTSASASRVTRSSRSLRLAVAMFAGVLAVVTVLRAQETPPPAPVASPPAASPPAAPASEPVPAAGTTDEPAAGEQAADAAEATAAGTQSAPDATRSTDEPDSKRPVGPTPGRFEPTEKVRADFDVAFPIDI